MEPVIERALVLTARQPARMIPLADLAEELAREFPGTIRGEAHLAAWLARYRTHFRIVRAAHASWQPWVARRDAAPAGYREALRGAGVPITPYVVAVRLPERDAAAGLFERVDALVAALARELDEGASLAAAHWGRIAREARCSRRAIAGETSTTRNLH